MGLDSLRGGEAPKAGPAPQGRESVRREHSQVSAGGTNHYQTHRILVAYVKKTHLGSWKSKQNKYVKFHWLLAEELIITAMPSQTNTKHNRYTGRTGGALLGSRAGAVLQNVCYMGHVSQDGQGRPPAPAQHSSHLSQHSSHLSQDRQGP